MLPTLTELCQEIHNWFDKERYFGSFEIADGEITVAGESTLYTAPNIQEGQYIRIKGSWFNDGVHRYPDASMRDEVFSGSVWLLAIPEPVIKLATEIAAWREKYEAIDSAAMSPFQSESFGGYSYSKSGSKSGSGANSGLSSWVDAFGSRLNRWRKL